MEKLSDFFAEIKNRVTNPLFASFAISWLIVNWKIPVGLLSPISVLKQDGYTSYINLIEKNNLTAHFFWYPFFLAVGYTIGFPWIRTGILALNTWIKKISTDWNLKISKEGTVSIEKYMVLRESYLNKKEELSRILDQDAFYMKKNDELTLENISLLTESNKLAGELQKEKQSIWDINIMKGEWRFQPDANIDQGMRITINSNNISILREEKEHIAYRIKDFHHNAAHKTIIFIRESTTNNSVWACHSLKYNIDMTEMVGIENNNNNIKYVRIK